MLGVPTENVGANSVLIRRTIQGIIGRPDVQSSSNLGEFNVENILPLQIHFTFLHSDIRKSFHHIFQWVGIYYLILIDYSFKDLILRNFYIPISEELLILN